MAKTRRVVYARINRRPQDTLFPLRPIREEMQVLADSKETVAEVYGVNWYAADFQFDPSGDFLAGVNAGPGGLSYLPRSPGLSARNCVNWISESGRYFG